MHCKSHKCYFSIYPPGWGPYLRQPMLPMSADGSTIIDSSSSTYFSSGLDYSQKKFWPEDRETENSEESAPGVYRTQINQITRIGCFLNLFQNNDQVKLEISSSLNIFTDKLITGAIKVRDGPKIKAISDLVGEIHQSLSIAPLNVLMELGERIGLWGTPIIKL